MENDETERGQKNEPIKNQYIEFLCGTQKKKGCECVCVFLYSFFTLSFSQTPNLNDYNMDTINDSKKSSQQEKTPTETPSSPCARLKSVPIPQPLILKRRTSKSSLSSCDDQSVSKLTTPIQQNFNELDLTSPTNSTSGVTENRRSFLNDIDYSSSPGSDFNDTLSTTNRSPPPPPPTLSSSSFSPRYSSPPAAGSGGKYMVRSKRASWIDGSSSMMDSSTPPTPHTQPSKVPLLIPPLGLPKPIAVPSPNEENSLKSGSLSKLREDRQTQYHAPKRENSTDSSSAPLSSSPSTDNPIHSFLLNKSRKQSEDDGMEEKRSPARERKASVSSIMTDSSLASEEFYSPLSSPRMLYVFRK